MGGLHAVAIIQCALLTCWFPTKWAVGVSKRKRDAEETKVQMPHHSFAVPLSYEELLKDWMISGASLAETERLLLHPNVSERAAFAWNKFPILTNNFEVDIHFKVVGTKDLAQLASDQSFAFWYVYENVTNGYNETKLIKAKTWKTGLNGLGMTLSGAKARFSGFGAVMSMTDTFYKKARSVVSGIWNNGNKALKYAEDVPTVHSKPVDFRNTLNSAQLKIRVTPTSIEGHLKQSPSLSWNECFKLDRSNDRVKAGGYVGFSAWSGSKSEETVADTVSITQLAMYNHDTNGLGEQITDVSADIQEAFREMLTDKNRHFIDQKSQTQHLKRLMSMVTEHTKASSPVEAKMFQDLEQLEDRMSRLGDDCKTLTKELEVLVKADGEPVEQTQFLKDEIIGLRRLLMKDKASHQDKIDAVKKNIEEVRQKHADAPEHEAWKQAAAHRETLQGQIQTRFNMIRWCMYALMAVAAVISVFIYKRIDYYGKKHFI
mmetsp:Transcript_127977/g.220718  ORF Transcript_127977/g.220718 Transcript_127977/m.220718 type:complete len:488 (+) Transcript_127977:130-1593(+)